MNSMILQPEFQQDVVRLLLDMPTKLTAIWEDLSDRQQDACKRLLEAGLVEWQFDLCVDGTQKSFFWSNKKQLHQRHLTSGGTRDQLGNAIETEVWNWSKRHNIKGCEYTILKQPSLHRLTADGECARDAILRPQHEHDLSDAVDWLLNRTAPLKFSRIQVSDYQQSATENNVNIAAAQANASANATIGDIHIHNTISVPSPESADWSADSKPEKKKKSILETADETLRFAKYLSKMRGDGDTRSQKQIAADFIAAEGIKDLKPDSLCKYFRESVVSDGLK